MANKRKLTLDQARARYPHRFTMDYSPRWAKEPFEAGPLAGKYPAPQYASDLEWYENTVFPGEPGLHGNCKHCQSGRPTWPLGLTLTLPYSRRLATSWAC